MFSKLVAPTIIFITFILQDLLLGFHVTVAADLETIPDLRSSKSDTNLDPSNNPVYLPVITNYYWGSYDKRIPIIHVPYFQDEITFEETAVFWFGDVTPTDNYADARIGYTSEHLYLRLGIFDRLLWYDQQPTPDSLQYWDALELFIKMDNVDSNTIDQSTYRFIGQLNWWEDRDNWQASYQGNGASWAKKEIPFTTISGWRGNAPNDTTDDRGWSLVYKIPFTSLGISSPPNTEDVWKIAVNLYDRDDQTGSPIPTKSWPNRMEGLKPSTWGEVSFGYPKTAPTNVIPDGITTIRHKLNGAQVYDAHVGGHTTCGQEFSPSFFDGWGDANYAYYEQINIQNQADVADWPCFSKFYVSFPLDQIPAGAEILSATLTMHQFGNAGDLSSGDIPNSYIQVATIKELWNENSITWNNAPLAYENISSTWVSPIYEFPGWPGVPRKWDVTRALDNIYPLLDHLGLVLYSPDSAMHSGKYFISSDTGDWNEIARPTLEIIWKSP